MRLSLHCLVDVYLVRFNKNLAPPPLVFRLAAAASGSGRRLCRERDPLVVISVV